MRLYGSRNFCGTFSIYRFADDSIWIKNAVPLRLKNFASKCICIGQKMTIEYRGNGFTVEYQRTFIITVTVSTKAKLSSFPSLLFYHCVSIRNGYYFLCYHTVFREVVTKICYKNLPLVHSSGGCSNLV